MTQTDTEDRPPWAAPSPYFSDTSYKTVEDADEDVQGLTNDEFHAWVLLIFACTIGPFLVIAAIGDLIEMTSLPRWSLTPIGIGTYGFLITVGYRWATG